MPDQYAADSLKILSLFIYRYYGKKIIILLDEYDTPTQEAYLKDTGRSLLDLSDSFLTVHLRQIHTCIELL